MANGTSDLVKMRPITVDSSGRAGLRPGEKFPQKTNRHEHNTARPDHTNLSYPANVGEDQQQGHYIMFHILASGYGKGPKGGPSTGELNPGAIAAQAGGGSVDYWDDQVTYVQKNVNSNVTREGKYWAGPAKSRIPVGRNWTKLKQAITLYMPPSVKVSYKTDYKDEEISAKAVAGAGVIEAFSNRGDETEAIKGWRQAGNAIVEGAALAGMSFLKGAADTLAPGASALAQISAGAVIGSKMELLFQGVGRRDFQYTFTFIPKSAQEASMVSQIVYAFKTNMLPEYAEGKFLGRDIMSSGRILTIPNAFDISYMHVANENPWINKISSCYLTNMEVEYGGDKFVTYPPMEEPVSGEHGPPPQRTVVSLSFSEIAKITRESVKELGY